jgi:hypothetical protein
MRKPVLQILMVWLCCAAPLLAAETLRVDRVDVIKVGIYEVEIAKRTEDKDIATGFSNWASKVKNVSETTTIPARLGVRFGFEYLLVGAPQGGTVPIRVVTKFPKQGVRNPQTRTTTYREEIVINKLVGQRGYSGYGFDKEWELVPGTWTLEIWYHERKLAEQSFTVVKP